MPDPLAFFITFTTYGAWLHGRESGSVDRRHNTPGTPLLSANPDLEQARQDSLRQEPYLLDHARRHLVLRTIQEVAEHRLWKLWAVHVRTNHVHIVVTAPSNHTRPPNLRAESVSAGFSANHPRPENTPSGIHVPNYCKPEKVMADFKAWTSRRLREAFSEPRDREHWTRHGSTRWLNTQTSLHQAIAYVLAEQGEPLACFDGRNSSTKPYEPKA